MSGVKQVATAKAKKGVSLRQAQRLRAEVAELRQQRKHFEEAMHAAEANWKMEAERAQTLQAAISEVKDDLDAERRAARVARSSLRVGAYSVDEVARLADRMEREAGAHALVAAGFAKLAGDLRRAALLMGNAGKEPKPAAAESKAEAKTEHYALEV